MGTEVHMDSNMDGVMGNNYQELLILTEFGPRKGSASLKSFSQAVSVPGAHQPRTTSQQAILETVSFPRATAEATLAS